MSALNGGPSETPIADLREHALRHYDAVAMKACDWYNVIPIAINFYFDAQEAAHAARQRTEVEP